MPERLLTLCVRRIRREADGINSYELADPAGAALPPFAAGAHIDVYLPAGTPAPEGPGPDRAMRQYSLCNDPRDRDCYVIAVLVEAAGKGASSRLHDRVREGDSLTVSAPRNRFPLVEGAARYLLLAGGIGVTPLLSMAARLAAVGADFELHHCTKSPALTPFRERLAALAGAGRVVHHHDGGDPAKGLDIAALLAAQPAGTHLYYCGPLGFMRAVGARSAGWPAGTVHCEYFMPEAPPDTAAGRDRFRVAVAATGVAFEILPGQTLLAALRGRGLLPVEACATGDCGLCRVRYVAGEPVHRDRLLTDSERREYVLACQAGSRSPLLVVEL